MKFVRTFAIFVLLLVSVSLASAQDEPEKDHLNEMFTLTYSVYNTDWHGENVNLIRQVIVYETDTGDVVIGEPDFRYSYSFNYGDEVSISPNGEVIAFSYILNGKLNVELDSFPYNEKPLVWSMDETFEESVWSNYNVIALDNGQILVHLMTVAPEVFDHVYWLAPSTEDYVLEIVADRQLPGKLCHVPYARNDEVIARCIDGFYYLRGENQNDLVRFEEFDFLQMSFCGGNSICALEEFKDEPRFELSFGLPFYNGEGTLEVQWYRSFSSGYPVQPIHNSMDLFGAYTEYGYAMLDISTMSARGYYTMAQNQIDGDCIVGRRYNGLTDLTTLMYDCGEGIRTAEFRLNGLITIQHVSVHIDR